MRSCWSHPAAITDADRTDRDAKKALEFGLVAPGNLPPDKLLSRAFELRGDSPETHPWYSLHAPSLTEYLRRQMHDLLATVSGWRCWR